MRTGVLVATFHRGDDHDAILQHMLKREKCQGIGAEKGTNQRRRLGAVGGCAKLVAWVRRNKIARAAKGTATTTEDLMAAPLARWAGAGATKQRKPWKCMWRPL
jgi:hypothetical protein